MLDQEPDATAPPTAAVAETTAAEPEVGTDDTAAEDAEPEMEQNIVEDDLGGMSLSDAIDATIVAFDDGDLVHGKVVKIDADEVLLDIGYKSEGVIPSKELSRSATTSTRTRSCHSAKRSKPLSSKKKTRTVA